MFRFGRKDKNDKNFDRDFIVKKCKEGYVFNINSEAFDDPEILKVLSKLSQINMLDFTLAYMPEMLGDYIAYMTGQMSVAKGMNLFDAVDRLREENKEEIQKVHDVLFEFYEHLSKKYNGDPVYITLVFVLTLCGELSGFIDAMHRKINDDVMKTAAVIAEKVDNI